MTIFFLPQILMLVYLFYILISKDNRDDRFFIEKKQLSRESLLNIIDELQTINKEDYSEVKKKINRYFADNYLTEYERERVEFYLTNSYFGGFKNRFIAFTKADIGLKSIYILTLVFSFIYFNLLIHAVAVQKELINDNMLWWHIGISIVLFIVPLTFWLAQLVFFSLALSIFVGIMQDKGKLNRSQIIVDELVKLLKPGGRNTPVQLGRPTMRDWVNGRPF